MQKHLAKLMTKHLSLQAKKNNTITKKSLSALIYTKPNGIFTYNIPDFLQNRGNPHSHLTLASMGIVLYKYIFSIFSVFICCYNTQNCCSIHVPLAQLVEHMTFNHGVTGSSPVWHISHSDTSPCVTNRSNHANRKVLKHLGMRSV